MTEFLYKFHAEGLLGGNFDSCLVKNSYDAGQL